MYDNDYIDQLMAINAEEQEWYTMPADQGTIDRATDLIDDTRIPEDQRWLLEQMLNMAFFECEVYEVIRMAYEMMPDPITSGLAYGQGDIKRMLRRHC